MSNSPELLESYRILGIKPGATLDEVERAYDDLSKTWDPNRQGLDPARRRRAEKKLPQIDRAYERLSAELKNGVAASAQDEETAPADSSETLSPGETPRHWSARWRFIFIPAMILAVLFLGIDSYTRFVGIWHTTDGKVTNEPVPDRDPTSTSGYAFNQHVQVMPALGTDGYHWIMQMERMLDGREGLRVRHVDYDGPPGGREVHWSSSLHWLVAVLAEADHLLTHDPMAVSLERTEPWANTFVLLMLMLILPVVAWRRFGGIPAAILALGFVTTYPYYEFSFVGYLDHHGLAASSDLLMVFFLACSGAGWLRNEAISPDQLTPTEAALWRWLPDRRQAKRWLIASGIATGTGLWISTASVIPAMFGVGLGALISTGYLAREPAQCADPELRKQAPVMMAFTIVLGAVAGAVILWLKWGAIGSVFGAGLGGVVGWLAVYGLLNCAAEKNPVGRADPTLWVVWGTAVAATSIFYYLLEYAPLHFSMRLEVNHPLYALAAYGAGDLLCRFSRLIQAMGNRDQSNSVGAVWRQNQTRIFAALAMVLLLPFVVLVGGESVFVIRPGFLLNLHTDYILEFRTFFAQMSLLAPLQIVGGISFIPLVALPMLLLLIAPDLQKQWKAVLGISLLPALILLALALIQIRWLGISCAMLCGGLVVAAAVTTLPGSAFRWRDGFRRPIAGLLLLVVLTPYPVFTIYQWIMSDLGNTSGPTELDLTQIVTRDAAERIRVRLGSEQGVILSGPTTTTWMMYFGGFKGVGTLYWENIAGLRAAAATYSARPLWEDAKKLVDENHVTHICIFVWDAFAEEYARLGAGMRKPADTDLKTQMDQARKLQDSFVLKLLTPDHPLPSWLRIIPYRIPDHPALRNSWVLLYEVVPPQTQQEAVLHNAYYALELGTPNSISVAGQELDQLLHAYPDYYPGMIAKALAAQLAVQMSGNADAATTAMQFVQLNLDKANTLNLEDRVYLCWALYNSRQIEEAIKQSAACLAMADEKGLRHLMPERLQLLLQLAANLPAGSYSNQIYQLGLSLLAKPLQAQVLAQEAAVAGMASPAKAAAFYRDALKAQPDFVMAMNGLTLLLATSSDAAVRNGTEAVKYAEQIAKTAPISHLQGADSLELLSVAYAEAGRWDDAIFYGDMALRFLQNSKNTAEADSWNEKLKLIHNHHAFHLS